MQSFRIHAFICMALGAQSLFSTLLLGKSQSSSPPPIQNQQAALSLTAQDSDTMDAPLEQLDDEKELDFRDELESYYSKRAHDRWVYQMIHMYFLKIRESISRADSASDIVDYLEPLTHFRHATLMIGERSGSLSRLPELVPLLRQTFTRSYSAVFQSGSVARGFPGAATAFTPFSPLYGLIRVFLDKTTTSKWGHFVPWFKHLNLCHRTIIRDYFDYFFRKELPLFVSAIFSMQDNFIFPYQDQINSMQNELRLGLEIDVGHGHKCTRHFIFNDPDYPRKG